MRFLADFHIHSRYSRATSKDLTPEGLAIWAGRKGISLLGTGDFTHPAWVSELKEKLLEKEDGLFGLSEGLDERVKAANPGSCRGSVRFVLTGEISCIYKKGGRTRKVHHLIFMPSFEALERFNRSLARIGNLSADGRPILGLDSRDLLEISLESDPSCIFIPAHIWTPWFSLFGSKSGFDSLEECLGDLSYHVKALETGLSSDPPMNRLISSLDGLNLISSSDAHSPSRLGREATVLDTEMSYQGVARSLNTGIGLMGTVEFFPEEGKYHLDGHRRCGIRYDPLETAAKGATCPVCGHALTIGVLNRVLSLADRQQPLMTRGYASAIPLGEVLSEVLGSGETSRRVTEEYQRVIETIGPELEILLYTSLETIARSGGGLLAEAISRMRTGRVIRDGGYDGQYGRIRLFREGELEQIKGQRSLFFAVPEPPSQEEHSFTMPAVSVSKPVAAKCFEASGDPLLSPLNDEQREAVTYNEGHILVEAGPGTGKTLTLTHRIAYIMREGLASPREIIALTFTRKAAEEMKRRVASLYNDTGGEGGPYIATFHAFCLDVLRGGTGLFLSGTGLEGGSRDGPLTLCHEWESERLAAMSLKEAGMEGRSARVFLMAAGEIRRAQALAVPVREESLVFTKALGIYSRVLRERGMLDYDDLETKALSLLAKGLPEGKEIRFIFIDEYQDTNLVQAEIAARLAAISSAKVFAIGDPDQSIYGFRDASPQSFKDFLRRFPGARKVLLRRNFRSTATILQAAGRIMEKDTPLAAESSFDAPIIRVTCKSASEEAEMVAGQIEKLVGGTSLHSFDLGRVGYSDPGSTYGFGDFAVLFRLNAMGDALEEAMNRAAIPYMRSGERPIASVYPVNLILACLRTMCNPSDPYFKMDYQEAFGGRSLDREALQRLLEEGCGAEGIIDLIVERHSMGPLDKAAEDALLRLREYAACRRPIELLDFIALDRGRDHAMLRGDRVSLMTIHASKGLEWPVVFVVGCEEGLIPCSIFGSRDEDEEKRLLYVAVTRAKERLFLSYAMARSLPGLRPEKGPSRFLSLIPPRLFSGLDGKKRARRRPRQMELFPSSDAC